MAVLNLIEAINAALDFEMGRDDSIVVFGEDVGYEGGVFRATVGLQEKYGAERCFDSVLAESAIIGTGIGMAINGLKPVVEMQFSGFMFPGYNQMVTHAARMRNRSRGRFTVPMVIRMPYGAGVRALEHHSESLEVLFAHIPGLKLVIPSTPYDAKGLLLAAMRDPDPVVFMEPKRIYRAFKQDIPDDDYTIKIGKAKVLTPGDTLTVVAWGAMIRDTQKAIALLGEKAKGIELIDLRSIQPWDRETVIASVKKTGRIAIVHEAVKSFGPAAEIIAATNEDAFLYLEAPPTRITGLDTIVPLPKGEHHYLPDAKFIANKLNAVLDY